MYEPPYSDTEPLLIKKVRYHHPRLREAAIRVGLEMVREGGPDALTLRGLARRLGVTAPAIVYHFGRRDDLRASIAEAALARAQGGTGLATGALSYDVRRQCEDWLDFVKKNANLYRLMAGEGWRRPGVGPHTGYTAGEGIAVPTPWRALENAFFRQSVAMHLPGGDKERAHHLALSLHGLAVACVDGLSSAYVEAGLKALLAWPRALDPYALKRTAAST